MFILESYHNLINCSKLLTVFLKIFIKLSTSLLIFREVLCLEVLFCRVITGSADGKVCAALLFYQRDAVVTA